MDRRNDALQRFETQLLPIDKTLHAVGEEARLCRNLCHCRSGAAKGGKREKVVSIDEFKAILDVTRNPNFVDLLNVTWETGCRPQESLRLEARHVDLVNQRWVFPQSESKTDAHRVVYLPDAALEITKRLMRRFPQGKLFRNSRGKPWTTDAVNCAFESIRIRLGRRLIVQRQK